MTKKIWAVFAVFLLSAVAVVGAQEADEFAPAIDASDQVSINGTVTVDTVTSDESGWVVIHAAENDAPGAVIGFRQVQRGENTNVAVDIDARAATPTLFAMLHYDNNEIGEYEFGTESGIDEPVIVSGDVVAASFDVTLIQAQDQFVEDNSVTVPVGIVQNDGWMVIHADDGEGRPGPVLGSTFLPAGVSTDIVVELLPDEDITNTLHPMLHEDTGEERSYEFGAVEGADLPIAVNDTLAVSQFATVPTINARQQLAFETFTADSVLSDGPGWLVIHAAADGGGPGVVIGAEYVRDGYNEDVQVSLNTDADFGSVVFPMLHEDTGEEGAYEFGTVEGADGPVVVNGEVLTFPTLIRPSSTTSQSQSLDAGEGNVVRIDNALIDAPGWMVIHADNGDGAPGEVLGFAPLLSGLNQNVSVLLDGDITPTVYAMLHYDTNEIGEYEFGAVTDADSPVSVAGAVVVESITLE